MDNNQTLAKEWFDAAQNDYLYAEIGLKEEKVFPQIAFLSQQSAEKMLKGYLYQNRVEIVKMHDLPKLLDECVAINSDLEKLRDSCELLSGFYIETRYPPDIPDYTKTEIMEAFNSAKLVKETIESLVQKL